MKHKIGLGFQKVLKYVWLKSSVLIFWIGSGIVDILSLIMGLQEEIRYLLLMKKKVIIECERVIESDEIRIWMRLIGQYFFFIYIFFIFYFKFFYIILFKCMIIIISKNIYKKNYISLIEWKDFYPKVFLYV